MDTFRYVMAVMIVIGLPPGIAVWFIVHPFIGFWRKRGSVFTFTVMTIFLLASMTGLFLIRDVFLQQEYGTSYLLIGLGVPFLAASVYVQYFRAKHLKFKTLAGGPEVNPSAEGGKLLTKGIYGKIRHPRYVEFMLGSVGWALITNYLATYVVTLLAFPMIRLVVILEERELRDRFGEAYVEYSARVPRFIPKK